MVVLLASMGGVEFSQLTKYGPPGVCMRGEGGGREGGREGVQNIMQFSFFKITKKTDSEHITKF